MPDILNENGLQIKSLSEIITELEEDLKEIYGNDIVIDSNSPDGQLINIISQAGIEVRELIADVNNSFDPSKADGTILDQRVIFKSLIRKGGTFTIIPVSVTVDQNITLQGLDADANNVDGVGYTVADNNGNEFILLDTTALTAGATQLNFRAKQIGEVTVATNTVTNTVTKALGVVSVNNSSGALQIGANQESDFGLRERFQQSDGLNSGSYLESLYSAVLSLDGVTDARLYENTTSVTDADGIPAHGMWLIVAGGANSEIADLIYKKIPPGTPQKGSVVVDVTTVFGTAQKGFDRPTAKDLYIQFDLQSTESGITYDFAGIKSYIEENLIFKISDYADTATITAICLDAINSTTGSGIPVNVEISDDGITYVDYLETDTKDEQFTVSADNITITEL